MGAGMLSLVAPTAAKVFAMNPLLAGAAPGKGYLFPELSSAQRFTMSWGVVAERVVTLIRSTPSRHTPVLSTTMLVSAGFAAETVIVPESNLSDTWTTVWPAGVLRAWDISCSTTSLENDFEYEGNLPGVNNREEESGLGVLDRTSESVQDESGLADAVRHDSEPYLQRPSLYLAHNVFRLCPTNSFVGY